MSALCQKQTNGSAAKYSLFDHLVVASNDGPLPVIAIVGSAGT
jgi:hypothetical protein